MAAEKQRMDAQAPNPPLGQMQQPIQMTYPQQGYPMAAPVPQQQPYALPTTSQQPIVLQIPASSRRHRPKKENYDSKKSKKLGIIQLVAGGIALVLNVIGIVINSIAEQEVYDSFGRHIFSHFFSYYYTPSYAYYVGAGIWCPALFFSLSGSFALCAAYKKTRCMIITNMVFSIFSSIAAFVMLCMAIWALTTDSVRVEAGFHYDFYDYNYYNFHFRHYYDSFGFEPYSSNAAKYGKGSLAVSVFFLLVSVMEFVVCIWSATLCCRVTCCDNSQRSNASARYVTSTGQPMGQPQAYVLNNQGQPSTNIAQAQATPAQSVIVLDKRGRPMTGAQVLQFPGSSGLQQPPPQTNLSYVPQAVPQPQMNTTPSAEAGQVTTEGSAPPPYTSDGAT